MTLRNRCFIITEIQAHYCFSFSRDSSRNLNTTSKIFTKLFSLLNKLFSDKNKNERVKSDELDLNKVYDRKIIQNCCAGRRPSLIFSPKIIFVTYVLEPKCLQGIIRNFEMHSSSTSLLFIRKLKGQGKQNQLAVVNEMKIACENCKIKKCIMQATKLVFAVFHQGHDSYEAKIFVLIKGAYIVGSSANCLKSNFSIFF